MSSALKPPPRLTGDPQTDLESLNRWYYEFFNDIQNYFVQGVAGDNASGAVTISNTDTSATVDIEDQPDEEYTVVLTPQSYSGSPPDNAFSVRTVSSEKEQFTVTIGVAPGAGNSVTFTWHIRR